MNKDRRKRLEDLAGQLDAIRSDIETIKDEEQEYLDNMPESLKEGEKGSNAEQVISSLEEAFDDLDTVINNVNDAAQ